MKAKLLHHEKRRYDDGAILVMRLWQVDHPVPGCDHRLKYSLFYGRPGQRQVGYDNERGKGDHRHFDDEQVRYVFVSVRQLMADFLADVDKVRQDT
jgi:hypothetical protein